MLIVINYSHSGFPWRIKSHEELKEMAFFCFFFFLCRRSGDSSLFQLCWFSCASKKQRERRYTYGCWAAIMHKTPFQLPYKLLSVVGRGPACSRIRDGRFHGTVKAEKENKTGFSRFIHAPL